MLPAVGSRHLADAVRCAQGERHRVCTDASGLPLADESGSITVDRLERPQMLVRDDGVPTHCYAAMFFNGSAANVVLRLRRGATRHDSQANGRS